MKPKIQGDISAPLLFFHLQSYVEFLGSEREFPRLVSRPVTTWSYDMALDVSLFEKTMPYSSVHSRINKFPHFCAALVNQEQQLSH
jgi:hypothetical protein